MGWNVSLMRFEYKFMPICLGVLLAVPVVLLSASQGYHSMADGAEVQGSAAEKRPATAQTATGNSSKAGGISHAASGGPAPDPALPRAPSPSAKAAKSAIITTPAATNAASNADMGSNFYLGGAINGDLRVGNKIDAHDLHVVSRPGLYGIGIAPRGSQYGIIDHRLVRFNPQTMQIQSVIRMVDQIRD